MRVSECYGRTVFRTVNLFQHQFFIPLLAGMHSIECRTISDANGDGVMTVLVINEVHNCPKFLVYTLFQRDCLKYSHSPDEQRVLDDCACGLCFSLFDVFREQSVQVPSCIFSLSVFEVTPCNRVCRNYGYWRRVGL